MLSLLYHLSSVSSNKLGTQLCGFMVTESSSSLTVFGSLYSKNISLNIKCLNSGSWNGKSDTELNEWASFVKTFGSDAFILWDTESVFLSSSLELVDLGHRVEGPYTKTKGRTGNVICLHCAPCSTSQWVKTKAFLSSPGLRDPSCLPSGWTSILSASFQTLMKFS